MHFFEKEDPAAHLDEIIAASLRIKRSVVEEDEKESGVRRILNFGHTVAHALESENRFADLYHGEAVAVGMVPMCSPAVRRRLVPILKKLGLPVTADWDPETVVEAMRHDKKRSGDRITVIRVETPGECEMREIPFDEFAEMVRKGREV